MKLLDSLPLLTLLSKPSLSTLQYSVYQAAPIAVHYPPLNLTWSPITITLIHSANSAILIDAPISVSQTQDLIAWIKQTIPSQPLTKLYITHGHGDHFFGVPVLRTAFPELEVIATAPTIAHILETLDPATFATSWGSLFPNGQIPDQSSVPSLLTALPPDGHFDVDGHALHAIEVGESDTWNTTVLHVPSLGLVVAGDVIYGSYYQYLGDSNTTTLQDQWLRALDKIANLKPLKAIVPGHMKPSDGFGLEHLESTRRYILAWKEEVVRARGNSDVLVANVLRRFPERAGEFILRFSASFYFGG